MHLNSWSKVRNCPLFLRNLHISQILSLFRSELFCLEPKRSWYFLYPKIFPVFLKKDRTKVFSNQKSPTPKSFWKSSFWMIYDQFIFISNNFFPFYLIIYIVKPFLLTSDRNSNIQYKNRIRSSLMTFSLSKTLEKKKDRPLRDHSESHKISQ